MIPTSQESTRRLGATLDPVVARVSSTRDAWVRVGIPERVALLEQSIRGVLSVAEDWVKAACQAKGIDPRSSLAGEEWISGPMTTTRSLRLLSEAIAAGGAPKPMRVRTRPDGQVVADVFPHNLRERLMYSHMTVEVWIEPGKPPTQGRIYREKAMGHYPDGRTCLVLGAGNVSSIGPLDVIDKLFVEDEVCVLKMNPVNDYLAPFFERAFAVLVDRGVLAVVRGGPDVGQYLVRARARRQRSPDGVGADPRRDRLGIHARGTGATQDQRAASTHQARDLGTRLRDARHRRARPLVGW